MHYRFKGNPNTNAAGRWALTNEIRKKKGLPPLPMPPELTAALKTIDPVGHEKPKKPKLTLF